MPYPLRRKVHNVSQCQIVRFRSSNFKIPGTTTTMQTRALRSVPQGQRELEGFEQGCKVIHPHPGCCTTGRPGTNTHGPNSNISSISSHPSISSIFLSHHITSHLSHHSHWFSSFLFSLSFNSFFSSIQNLSHCIFSSVSILIFQLIVLIYLIYHISPSVHLSHLSPHLSHLSHLSHHIFLIFFSPESHCPHLSYLLIYLIPIDLNPRPRPHSSYTSFFKYHIT